MKKFLSFLFDLLNLALVLLFVLLAFGSVDNKLYRILIVEGNSTTPTVRNGDLIAVTPLKQEVPLDSIAVLRVNGELVTHRIVGFGENNRLITKGDTSLMVDDFSGKAVEIVGVYRGRLPGLGYPLMFLSNLMRSA